MFKKLIAAITPDMHKVYLNSSEYYRIVFERHGATLTNVQAIMLAQNTHDVDRALAKVGYVKGQPIDTLAFVRALGY